MPSIAAPKVIKEASGKVRIRFGKREYEFNSIEEARASVRSQLGVEDLELLTMALMFARQPNLGNPAAFEGRKVNVDFKATNWGTIS